MREFREIPAGVSSSLLCSCQFEVAGGRGAATEAAVHRHPVSMFPTAHTPLMEPMVEHGELGVDYPADRTPSYRKSYSPSAASAEVKREVATSKRISLSGKIAM